jgi:hypothetical protein
VTAVATETGFQAGLYPDMPEAAYHADPVPGGSLSSSGAKKMLPPSCPARFRWERDHPPQSTPAMETGTAAHRLVLGTGTEITEVKADSWRTSAARAAADEARAEGKVPLLSSQLAQVRAMADALREHPVASALFDPERGRAEQSLFWQDELTGVWRRARLDWLPYPDHRRRFIIGDFKSTASADPRALARAVYEYGYYMQAPCYIDGVEALGLAEDPAFVFVAQEKTPPYLVSVFQLSPDAVIAGRRRNQLALERYRDCAEAGVWPGYDGGITEIDLPYWAARHLDEELVA